MHRRRTSGRTPSAYDDILSERTGKDGSARSTVEGVSWRASRTKTTASHSFPVDVDDDQETPEREGADLSEEADGRGEVGDDIDEAQRQLIKRTQVNLGHPGTRGSSEF